VAAQLTGEQLTEAAILAAAFGAPDMSGPATGPSAKGAS